MKSVIALAVVFVASLVFAPAPAFAASGKGMVTAVTADSMTVKAAGKDMTFAIDGKTSVMAKGGSTATKKAEAAGAKGPKLTDVVKVGDEVEVTYKDVAGKMMASAVHVTKKAAKK